MTRYTIETAASQRRVVELSAAIAQGAAGTIHHIIGSTGDVVKLYKDPKTLAEYEEKIGAMLLAPPSLARFVQNGRTYVQIAWPTAKLFDETGKFAGFVMPEVDFQASTELENMLQKSARKQKKLPEFYGMRVLLAANMAALCAELHKLGHYIIDMKPVNMRFYPQSSYMAILDTDGFSINGQRRLPARQYSDEYIAPEAKGKPPEALGEAQDLFSLAVIIFRLLNNGIHPFQGVDKADHPTNLQDRIFAGLYAYGLKSHRSVDPAPSSIHAYFETTTRALFDRAFTKPHNRPSAAEWRDHLNKFITDKTLIRCAQNEAEHAHFSKGCGLCELDKRRSGQRKAAATPTSVQSSAAVLGNLLTGSKLQPKPAATPRERSTWLRMTAVLAGIAGIIGVAAWNLAPAKKIEPPPPPAPIARISNAVLASAIENNRPKDISRVFTKPGAPIALYFDYNGAKPGMDTILIKVKGGSETFQPCELTRPLYVDGSYNCRWLTGASADQTVVIEWNGKETETLPFKVTPPPPPRPPIDLRPPAQTTPAPIPALPPVQPMDDASRDTTDRRIAPPEPPLKLSAWGMMFKEQLDSCWRRPPGRREPQGVQISLGVSLTPQGTIEQPPRPVRAHPPSAQSYYDRVVRAMYGCQPYRLPPARFNEWRYLEMSFSDG